MKTRARIVKLLFVVGRKSRLCIDSAIGRWMGEVVGGKGGAQKRGFALDERKFLAVGTGTELGKKGRSFALVKLRFAGLADS